MRLVTCFALPWCLIVFGYISSPCQSFGQAPVNQLPPLECNAKEDTQLQIGNSLLKGDLLFIAMSEGEKDKSYVIAAHPQYRRVGGDEKTSKWKNFNVAPAYKNTSFTQGTNVCSWVQTTPLETSRVEATLFVPYDALHLDMPAGEYTVRYVVTFQHQGKIQRQIEHDAHYTFPATGVPARAKPKQQMFHVKPPAT